MEVGTEFVRYFSCNYAKLAMICQQRNSLLNTVIRHRLGYLTYIRFQCMA